MKIKEFRPEDVVVAPEYRARKGAPDPANVQRIAESIANVGQLQPGIVRDGAPDGKVFLIAGEHRLEAERLLNTMLGEGEKPFVFHAVVVKAGDEQALIDAIVENEYRVASDVFDRCSAMQRLVDMGKTQADIAKVFGVSEATVTQTLKAGKLPVKYQKMVKNGDMTQDAALLLADVDDKTLQGELVELAIRHRTEEDELEARIADKQAEKEAEAAEETGEAEESEDGKKGKKKPAKKGAKKGASKSKGKVTKEDVKAAKHQKGLSKESVPVSKAKFVAALEALGEEEGMPKSAIDLMGRIEGFLDGEYTITQLANSFKKNCVQASGQRAA